ncbi:MAG: hypothetical protein V4480_00095 [Patescibacteria group bacterium]
MKIVVEYDGNRKDGSSGYLIRTETWDSPPADNQRIQELLPRIRAMAQRQFGDDFVSLDSARIIPNALDLRVKSGTTKNNRFEKRAFFGWVQLFDNEPEVPI